MGNVIYSSRNVYKLPQLVHGSRRDRISAIASLITQGILSSTNQRQKVGTAALGGHTRAVAEAQSAEAQSRGTGELWPRH
ncbi:hypothetical protein PanWU01x14_106550 [Parasponia andersonii]|uniref:Uncharacterized protein n=1 Tax=Parasponia andersonii TaxID=3476 RepID=A0A2P5D0N9_PARAD|nr:hypothetical protein PanWU01x14_106550 [Parasponia andersonii]